MNIEQKYKTIKYCQQLKSNNQKKLNTEQLNPYQKGKLRGENEAYEKIMNYILRKDDE